MKYNQLKDLAKRSIALHKKNTQSISRSIAISFILLVPILIATLGYNVAYSKKINSNPKELYFQTQFIDYHIESKTIRHENNSVDYSGAQVMTYIDKQDKLNSKIIFDNFNTTYKQIFINNKQININEDYNKNAFNFSIIDTDKSNCFFPKNISDIYLENYDIGFTDKGKQQVVLSEKFLQMNNLKPNDVYLKQITIYNEGIVFLSNNNDETVLKGNICKDYTVVGILKASVYDEYSQVLGHLMSSMLYFTSVNCYKDGVSVLKPYSKERPNGFPYLIYDNYKDIAELNKEYMLLFYVSNTHVYFDFANFKSAHNGFNQLSGYYENIAPSKEENSKYSNIQLSQFLTDYMRQYEEMNTVFYFLDFVTFVLIASAIIHLYITLKESISSRKYYLSMMRAIGCHDSDIIKLYLVEATLILRKSILLIATFGTIISIVMKIILDVKFKKYIYDIVISWPMLIFTMLLSLLALWLVGMLIAYVCTYKLSKANLVKMLSEN